jgi:hypothetical protein
VMPGARELVGALLLSFVAGAACNPSHEVAAKNYGRNCASVADCTTVYEGPIDCCGGGCANAAIRVDAISQYTSDFNDALPRCEPAPPCAPLDCQTGRVACVSGVCQLEAPDAGAAD